MPNPAAPWEDAPVVAEEVPPAGDEPWTAAPVEEEGLIDKIRRLASVALTTPLPMINAVQMDPMGALLRMTGLDKQAGTAAGALDNLPMTGAAIGTPGGPGGVALGGAAGESFRQLIRRMAGLPAATGMIQKFTDMDPNGPLAAVTGIGAEAALGPVGEVVNKATSAVTRPISNWLGDSALRSLNNLLQPGTQVEKSKALELATRMQTEGIAPIFSTRSGQIERSEGALADALIGLRDQERILSSQGAQLNTDPILEKVVNATPMSLPGGDIPLSGKAQRMAALKTFEDMVTATGGNQQVPLELGLHERARLDELLKSFYATGRENVPVAAAPTKIAADAWRAEINDTFPELGSANSRVSDLITITDLLKQAHYESRRVGGLGTAGQEGAAMGAAAAGRTSIMAMMLGKAGITSGPIASLSAGGKQLLSNLLKHGSTGAQAWLRLADIFHVGDMEYSPDMEDERNLTHEGVSPTEPQPSAAPSPTPTPSPTAAPGLMSEDDFIRKYQ